MRLSIEQMEMEEKLLQQRISKSKTIKSKHYKRPAHRPKGITDLFYFPRFGLLLQD